MGKCSIYHKLTIVSLKCLVFVSAGTGAWTRGTTSNIGFLSSGQTRASEWSNIL